MMRRISLRQLILVIAMICFVCFASISPCFANSLDDLGGNNQTTTSDSGNGENGSGNSISDYLTGYTPITDESMQKANELAGPIATAIGTLTGIILVIVSAAIFLVTALDLAYIGVPFLRKYLNSNYMAGGQAQAGGMPMAGGMMGGRMGMMGGGMQPQGAPVGGGHCFVSDEAIAAVNLANPQPQAAGGMPMGGMGMGMMGGGMGMMGGGMQPQQAQPTPTKSVIFSYLKKRMFFIIIFTVCMVILMSSVLTDCGVNLAELLSKVIQKLNGSMSGISM